MAYLESQLRLYSKYDGKDSKIFYFVWFHYKTLHLQSNYLLLDVRSDRVYHEPREWYVKCAQRSRNKGLYTLYIALFLTLF